MTYGYFPYTTFTNTTVNTLRQQMDESNHELMHMLTQMMTTLFNPIMENTHTSYQDLTRQIGRIADVFRAPDDPVGPPRVVPAPRRALEHVDQHEPFEEPFQRNQRWLW